MNNGIQQRCLDLLANPDLEWLQIGVNPTRVLPGARFVETRTVREASAVVLCPPGACA